MRRVSLFRGATGLNTVVDPVRLPFNPETGISDLAVAVNVTVDRTGRVSRRSGFTQKISLSDCHSLFCDGGACLFVAGDTLYQLLPDYSRVAVRVGLTAGARMDYCQVDDGSIYYCNGSEYGIFRDGASLAWSALPYVGPPTNRVFEGPFAGEHIAFFASRIYMSEGSALWWSEPYAFSWFDRARSFIPLDSRVLMIKPVVAGLFISSERATYFLRGAVPKEQILERIANYPAIEWSAAIDYVDGLEIGLQEPGLCALWASKKGACLGTSQGQLINLNRDKVVYPAPGSRGAGLLRGYEFIHTIE